MASFQSDVVILGAGIGGFEAFRMLNRYLRRAGLGKKITLIDQNNYFTFVPLLHEVAVGAVEPEHCTLALREVVARTPHQFIKARVTRIDPVKKLVALDCPEFDGAVVAYDVCVVALGSTINYFGVPGAAEHSYHIRTLENAVAFKNALINRFDTPDPHITVSVVGGGPSGVEVVAQIAHLVRRDLARLYPRKTAAIRLIEQSAEIVLVLPPRARWAALERLKRLGVEILTSTGVKAITSGALTLAAGETIESDLTLWTAGLKGLADTLLPVEYCKNGRLPVTGTLQHPQAPSLYAIGDIALVLDERSKQWVPQLGEAAHCEAEYVANHLMATWTGKKIKSFHFKSKGTLMPIGEYYGLLIRGNFVLAGFVAWWIRRTVYVWFMPGLIRKLKIASDWTLRLFGFADIVTFNKR